MYALGAASTYSGVARRKGTYGRGEGHTEIREQIAQMLVSRPVFTTKTIFEVAGTGQLCAAHLAFERGRQRTSRLIIPSLALKPVREPWRR